MRGLLGLLVRVVLLPLSLLGGFLLAISVLGTLIAFGCFFFMPFWMAFGLWIKCLMGVALGYAMVWCKERLALWVEGY